MTQKARSLEQLKLNAANDEWGWGAWCQHWGLDPVRDMHPNDERALLDGCYFDLAAANEISLFFENRLTVPHAGQVVPFILWDWWFRDVLGPVFGWKRSDGRRRFDKGFISTAKKSGKSTVLAGLPAYMLIHDGEQEAECYSTAVDRDQAAIVYTKTARMVKKSPSLSKRLKITESRKRIYDEETGSWYEAISSDADSADGKNPHLLITDELHRWKDRNFFNALMYGDIQREQPLFLQITTAGDDLECVGFEEYEFARDLLDPSNDVYTMSHFAVIHEAGYQRDDAGELIKDEQGRAIRREWDDPAGWVEANPTIAEDNPERRIAKLQAKCDEAKTSPRKKREFMRFICNIWVTDVAETYIAWDDWLKCGNPLPSNLNGKQCSIGLDLSSLIDLTSMCLAFPNGNGGYWLQWKFWMPADDLKTKEERDKAPYRDWIDEGWIEATPGRRVDYNYIRRAISGVELDEQGAALPTKWIDAAAIRHNVQGVGYDPWNSEKLITELADYDGIQMLEIRQGFVSMNRPCKRLREMIVNGEIAHGNNPVANWMIRNCKCDTDPAGNIKLNKKKSRKRIDGIVAAVMAIEADQKLPGASGAWSGQSGAGIFG